MSSKVCKNDDDWFEMLLQHMQNVNRSILIYLKQNT